VFDSDKGSVIGNVEFILSDSHSTNYGNIGLLQTFQVPDES